MYAFRVDVPACCPRCAEPFCWEIDLRVERELAWAAPRGPAFLFRCAACGAAVRVELRFQLERGAHPRPLRLVGGAAPCPPVSCILLVDGCPHDCGARLGLQLDPDDPGTSVRLWPDEPLLLGGYRCPRCDGEGRLRLQAAVSADGES